jgi:hypothetical protein
VLRAKPCHRFLARRAGVLGLEAFDLLLIFPVLFVGSIVAGNLLLALVATALSAACLAALKWNKLPGYTQDLVRYVFERNHHSAFGSGSVAPQPHGTGRHRANQRGPNP